MSWSPIILIEIVLVFGSVLAWGLWELRSLRREREKRERAQAEKTGAAPPKPDAAS